LQAHGGTGLDWPHKVLAEHLAISLIYDLPESMMQVQQAKLSVWGVTFEQALDAAVDNLREISKQPFTMPQPGVWASPYRDNYDTSRLLLTDLIRDHSVKGEPVATVPNRDTLLFTGSDDMIGLENMLALAEAGLAQPRPITAIPFLLAGETWQPYLPNDAGHPLYQKFRLAWVKSIGMEYNDQKGLLDTLHQKTGQEIFVASYLAMQMKDTGEIVSYAVWSKGAATLLPRTDLVHFFIPTGENAGNIAASADWGSVMRVVGDLLEPQGLYPERYRVKRFPSEEQLRLLGGQ